MPTPLTNRTTNRATNRATNKTTNKGRNKSRYRGTVSEVALEAEAAYRAGDLERTLRIWEGAHVAALEGGDAAAAADCALRVAIHLLIDTGFMAPVRCWVRRAARLLEGVPEGPAHAWLAVIQADERLLSGDYPSAGEAARRAAALGSALSARAPVALARVCEGRALIFQGEVTAGLALLDEAGAAVLSGELDAVAAGIVYCELVCAYQGLALYDRAEDWTSVMARWGTTEAVGSFGGRCRVHRAELLRLRGEAAAAEAEAVRACEELRPYLRLEYGWPLTELGRIRLCREDYAGAAEAFGAAREIGWDVEPWSSLLLLRSGRVDDAVQSIRAALTRPLPSMRSKELPPHNELRRAPLLEAAVEIFLAGGRPEEAEAAAGALEEVVRRFDAPALRAGAAAARGRVLQSCGDAVGAADAFDESVRLWSEVGAARERDAARALLAAPPPGPPASPATPAEGAVFRRDGDFWTVGLSGADRVLLKDMRGLAHLSRLLATPGREWHVLDLAVHHTEAHVSPGLPGLDEEAKRMYRRRLADIEEDAAEATALGDAERAARSDAEREFILRELARAVGLGGRDRRAGASSERARASVTRAIRLAIGHISALDPPLGEHLTRTIRTGTYCTYLPDPRLPVAWEL